MLSNRNMSNGGCSTTCHSSVDDREVESIYKPKMIVDSTLVKMGLNRKINKMTNLYDVICYKHGNNENESAVRDVRMSKDNAFDLFGTKIEKEIRKFCMICLCTQKKGHCTACISIEVKIKLQEHNQEALK